jgi:hypothetical protein
VPDAVKDKLKELDPDTKDVGNFFYVSPNTGGIVFLLYDAEHLIKRARNAALYSGRPTPKSKVTGEEGSRRALWWDGDPNQVILWKHVSDAFRDDVLLNAAARATYLTDDAVWPDSAGLMRMDNCLSAVSARVIGWLRKTGWAEVRAGEPNASAKRARVEQQNPGADSKPARRGSGEVVVVNHHRGTYKYFECVLTIFHGIFPREPLLSDHKEPKLRAALVQAKKLVEWCDSPDASKSGHAPSAWVCHDFCTTAASLINLVKLVVETDMKSASGMAAGLKGMPSRNATTTSVERYIGDLRGARGHADARGSHPTVAGVYARSALLSVGRLMGYSALARQSRHLAEQRRNTLGAGSHVNFDDILAQLPEAGAADRGALQKAFSTLLEAEHGRLAKEEASLKSACLDAFSVSMRDTKGGRPEDRCVWRAIKVQADAPGGERRLVTLLPHRDMAPYTLSGSNLYSMGVFSYELREGGAGADAAAPLVIRGSRLLREFLLPLLDLSAADGAPIRAAAQPAFSRPLDDVAGYPAQEAPAFAGAVRRNPTSWALAFCARLPIICTPLNTLAMVVRYRGGITRVIYDAVRNDPELKALVAEMVSGLRLAAPSSQYPEAPWHDARFGEKLLRRLADWYGHVSARGLKETIIDPALAIRRSKGKIDASGAFRDAQKRRAKKPKAEGAAEEGWGGMEECEEEEYVPASFIRDLVRRFPSGDSRGVDWAAFGRAASTFFREAPHTGLGEGIMEL